MDDKNYTWNDDKTIKTEINLVDAVKDVHSAKQFHKALFLRIFKSSLDEFQTSVLKMHKAHASDTFLRKLNLFSDWSTGGLILFLAVLRVADIWVNGYQGTKTGFDIGLTMQTCFFLFFLWVHGKRTRETDLRFSEARKRQSLAEALVCCHQAFLEIMDESNFPKPTLSET